MLYPGQYVRGVREGMADPALFIWQIQAACDVKPSVHEADQKLLSELGVATHPHPMLLAFLRPTLAHESAAEDRRVGAAKRISQAQRKRGEVNRNCSY